MPAPRGRRSPARRVRFEARQHSQHTRRTGVGAPSCDAPDAAPGAVRTRHDLDAVLPRSCSRTASSSMPSGTRTSVIIGTHVHGRRRAQAHDFQAGAQRRPARRWRSQRASSPSSITRRSASWAAASIGIGSSGDSAASCSIHCSASRARSRYKLSGRPVVRPARYATGLRTHQRQSRRTPQALLQATHRRVERPAIEVDPGIPVLKTESARKSARCRGMSRQWRRAAAGCRSTCRRVRWHDSGRVAPDSGGHVLAINGGDPRLSARRVDRPAVKGRQRAQQPQSGPYTPTTPGLPG